MAVQHIDVYVTHMELYPYQKDDIPIIENMYTATEKFTNKEVPCGYIIEDGKLYLPRGTSISKIENITGVKAKFIKDLDPSDDMDREYSSLYDPRNKVQEESIEFLSDQSPQLGLNLATGVGKTFCVAYTVTKLHKKALIITPNEMLKNQWINTFVKMFDYRPKNLMNIAGSNIMEAIVEDLVEPAEVYFVNHQTLRSYLTSHGIYEFKQFFKKIRVGIKVYDESHMEFANILMIDFFSNTERTWYLTATFDRSDKTESQCFKRAFSSVSCYGEIESKALTEKHVIYHVVNFDSRISPKHRAKLLAYPGFSSNKYGQYAFDWDMNDSAYKVIREILLKVKDIEGKTLIFVPLIDNVDTLVTKIKRDFPEKTVAAYHSKVDKSDKEAAEKKDIIVSTIKSCGTGRDIKGLRIVICAEPIASKVIAEQMIGRLRPYGEGKETFFFDVVDRCIAQINWFHNARFKKIQTLVKDVKYLTIDALTYDE